MAKSNKKSEVSFEIEKVYGYLNEKKDKVLVKVSWNGRPAKNEIRRCWIDENGNLNLGKGLPIEDSELDELVKLSKELPKPVDFNKVFESSNGIMGLRQQGLRTVDGFPVLRRRKGKL